MSRAEGMQGEALVARYLRERGYRLAAHGYCSRYGEIDLIAWDGDVLCCARPPECIWRRSGWTVPPGSMWQRSTPSTALTKPA